jgi:ferric-dicitrate binding protein FerR (iron transport regulator)
LRRNRSFATSFRALIAVFAIGAVASPVHAQTQSLENGAARLVSMAGRVSLLKDNIPWALSVGSVVQPQQVVVTGSDGLARFEVSDGSTFEVFPNSQVVFRNNRGNWQDLLEVFLGKVRVKIEHLGGQPNHNRVHTPTAVISVRGTVFDVDVEDSEATTLVLVEEGVVEVRHLLKPGDSKVLNAGEWVRVFRNQPLAVKYVDRGAVLQRAMIAARDALYQVMVQNPASPHAGTPGPATGGSPGDGCKGSSCPPPPPPPPPPGP